jgi:methylthioribose-1-phosphate isomerase
MIATKTICWDEKTGSVLLIDQTKLPLSYRIIRCRTVDRLITAIKRLEVRGAPALGIAGAYGVALAANTIRERDFHRYFQQFESAAIAIGRARPTAVNLSWGVQRVLVKIREVRSIEEIRSIALNEAQRVADEDAAACHILGDYGATLLPETCTVLTHCNAGALACREWGTALGVIRSAVENGKNISVIACETRPLLQGARLTAWELERDAIPVTVIPDSAAAFLMRRGEIDCVIVGADRITRDAVFNKIGTYMHAVCAKSHDIPFFVAAPSSTFDSEHTEEEIEIEEREREEVAHFFGHTTVPDNVPVRNPAFDVTPLSLVTAIITERGVIRPASGWVEIAGKHSVI